jgi:pyruvate dehydrogenase E1 component beta subunit
MWSAIADPDPVIILEAEALYDTTGLAPDDDLWSVPIGKARVARDGEALTIVTYGSGVALALDAAELLSAAGVSAEVIDLRTLRPLDMPAVLASARKTGRLLTLDDGPPACSIGAEVCAGVTAAAFSSLKAAPVRMAAADTPVPYAANLEALVLPAAEDIAAKALRLAGQDRV